MLQKPRGGGSFSEEVLQLEGQELVSVLYQRIGRKVTSVVIWKIKQISYQNIAKLDSFHKNHYAF